MVLSSAPFVAAMFSQCVLLLSLNWDTNMWTQRRAARMLRLVTLQTCGSVHCTKALDVPTEKVSCSPLLATSFGSIHIYVLWDITSPTWQLEKTAGGLYKLHDVNLKTFCSDFVSVLFVSLSCRSVLLRAYFMAAMHMSYGHCALVQNSQQTVGLRRTERVQGYTWCELEELRSSQHCERTMGCPICQFAKGGL